MSAESHCPRGHPEASGDTDIYPKQLQSSTPEAGHRQGLCVSSLHGEALPSPMPSASPGLRPSKLLGVSSLTGTSRCFLPSSSLPYRCGNQDSVHRNLISCLLTPKHIIIKLCPFHRGEQTQAQRCSLACGHCAPDNSLGLVPPPHSCLSKPYTPLPAHPCSQTPRASGRSKQALNHSTS